MLTLKTKELAEAMDLLKDVSQVTKLRSFNQSHPIQSTRGKSNNIIGFDVCWGLLYIAQIHVQSNNRNIEWQKKLCASV